MSGVEILGVVASIVQVAELGGRLSVKLCTFCHNFKHANKALRLLSKDVALTCNVLRQLGETLGQDDLAALYSPSAFETAQDVLRECEQVFQELENAIEQHSPDTLSKSRIEKVARKLKFLMNEAHLDSVAGNLERLKSTMLLMLNVVIYAGQIRSRRDTHELQAQRNLLLVLTSEKIESEKNYEKLTKTLQFTSITENYENVENAAFVDQPSELKDELYHYCQMVKTVLHDINKVQGLLDRDRISRVRNGFLDLHQIEATSLQHAYGQRALTLFRTHLYDPFNLEAPCQGSDSLNSTQATTQTQHHPQQNSYTPQKPNADRQSPPNPRNAQLSPQQIRERANFIRADFKNRQDQSRPVLQHQCGQMPSWRLTQTQPTRLYRWDRLDSQMMQALKVPETQLDQSLHHRIDRTFDQSSKGHDPARPGFNGPLRPDLSSQDSTSGFKQSLPRMPASPLPGSLRGSADHPSTALNISEESDFALDYSIFDNKELLERLNFYNFLDEEAEQTTSECAREQSQLERVPTTNAGTETENRSSAALTDSLPIPKDSSTEMLDSWILRWTTLEKEELQR